MNSLIIILTFIIADRAFGGEFRNINGTNYWISHPLKANYYQADRNCAINGMYLVSVHTQQNLDAVMEAINKYVETYTEHTHFWTSGTSLGHSEFYWAVTGYPITFSNWTDGYPKNQGKCIILTGWNANKFRWTDQNCDNQYHFICEDRINLPKIKGTECEIQQYN